MTRKLNVAMIGHGFMGKAHSFALMATPFFFKTGIEPVRKVVCGSDETRTKQAAETFGWEEHTTDWKTAVRRDDIDIVSIVTPTGLHAEIAIEAANHGKHIFCEKPFTATLDEAKAVVDAVNQNGVKHMVGFNYRRVPAIAVAKDLIESGRLGKIYHYRAVYLQDWLLNPSYPRTWKLSKELAVSGALYDLGTHITDLAMHLVGKISRVAGMAETFIKERPAKLDAGKLQTMIDAEADTSPKMEPVEVDDTTMFLARFENGAMGTFEATRFAAGRRNHNRIEINGSKGSIVFDLEDMNRLQYYNVDDPADVPGFRSIIVNERCHPYIDHWWPPGHAIGYENTFVNEYADFFTAITEDTKPEPSFETGLENVKVLDAVMRSTESDRWENV